MSIKAMDVCARGCCFSSTAAGFRGIDTGDTGFVAPMDALEFGRDIVQLLNSPDDRRRRMAVARRLYDVNFSETAYSEAWDAVTQLLLPNLNAAKASSSPPIKSQQSETSPDSGRECGEQRTANSASITTLKVGPVPKPQRIAAPQSQLSAIVCTYNRYDVLPDAIDSLLHQSMDPESLEIIVIDNSADQSAAARFRERYSQEPRVNYVFEPTPGLSHARNVGVARARSEIVAFIDDDAIATPDWASQIVRSFEKFDGAAGVVGGRVIPRWASERPPWLSEKLLSYLSIIDWGANLRPLRADEWLVGCNIAFDKQALLSVGGFSRALGRVGPSFALLSNEEIEVCEKIQEAGRTLFYCPDALVHHVIDPTRLTRTWFRRRAAWQAVSDYLKDGQKVVAYAPAAAERVQREFLNGSSHIGTGIFRSTDDPKQFARDVGLVYDVVVSVLAGGKEHEMKSVPLVISTAEGEAKSVPLVILAEKDELQSTLFAIPTAKYVSRSYWRNRLAKLQRSIRKRLTHKVKSVQLAIPTAKYVSRFYWQNRLARLQRSIRKRLTHKVKSVQLAIPTAKYVSRSYWRNRLAKLQRSIRKRLS